MSESKHLKCPCEHCGSSIEFPGHGIGMQIDCPHCSRKTRLLAPPAIEEAAPVNHDNVDATQQEIPTQPGTSTLTQHEGKDTGRGGNKVWIAVTIGVLAAGTAGFFVLRRNASEPAPAEHSTTTTLASPPNPAASPVPEAKDSALAKAAKSLDDLKVGAIRLEKAKGSSLVYAVGVMRNASDLQRFGVNIELELTDAGGKKVGTAKDYRDVIEPRQDWRFRALVLDSKAVSASVAQIREEE